MAEITNEGLAKKAESIVKPINVDGRLFADVGCALITDKDNVYLGVG